MQNLGQQPITVKHIYIYFKLVARTICFVYILFYKEYAASTLILIKILVCVK